VSPCLLRSPENGITIDVREGEPAMTVRPKNGLSVRGLLLVLLTACAAPAAWAQTVTPLEGPNFGTHSIGEVQRQLRASGGDGTYVWEVVAGSLPPGMSLRTDLPSWFPPDASAGLIGVATTPGTYPFTLRVTSNGESTDQDCTIKISPLVVTTHWDLPEAFSNKPASYTLTAAGNVGPLTWTDNSGVPPGMSLSTSGVLSGIPTAAGFYSVNFSVSDGTDTVWRNVQVRVSDIEITTAGELPNATQNASYSAVITANGGIAPYTFTADFLPNGLMLDPSGAISGTANEGPNKFGFNVRVTDANSASYSKRMSITVVGVPPALPRIGANLEDATLGWPYVKTVGVWSGTAPFTWTATGLPPGLSIRWGSANTLSWVDPGDLEISGTPTALGPFNVELTVTDADGKSATNTFPLKVSPLLDYASTPTGGTIFTPYTSTLRVIGGRLPYTAIQISGHLPVGLSFDPATFVISGTPNENGGFDTRFLVTDADGNTLETPHFIFINGGTDSTITVNHDGDLGTVTAGQSYSNQLPACCAPSYAWSVVGGSLPPGLGLSTAGLLSGTPTTLGTYTFLVQAAEAGDPANFGQRQFTMIVTPLWITSDTRLPNGFVNSFYSASLNANGGTGAVTWTLEPRSYLPPGLALGAGGTLSGTPTASGRYDFQLRVTDSAGHVLTRWFNVSIYAAGTNPPVVQLEGPNFGTYSIGEVQVRLRASGGDGTYAWSVVDGLLPPGVSVRPDGPPWFPPDASAGLIGVATSPGTYNFTLRVTSAGSTHDQACTIKISSLVVTTYWSALDAFVHKAFMLTLTAVNNAGPITWTFGNGSLPPGLTLDSSGLLSGTPTASGFYNFNFTVSDGTDTVWRNLNVAVFDIEITTPGELPNATQNASYTTPPITATGGTPPYTFTADFLPNGLNLDPSSGVISGTANTGPDKWGFNLTVTDASHVSYSKRMSITVVGVPPALPSVGSSLEDATLGWPFVRTAWVYAGGTGPFTWTATGLPPGLSIRWGSGNTLAWVTPGDLEISGTPTVLGNYNVKLTVTGVDGRSASNTFPLRVSQLLNYSFIPEGMIFTPYTSTLRVIGGTLPYTGAEIDGRLPAGLTFDPATFAIAGTPLENGGFWNVFLVTDDVGNTLRTGVFLSIGGGGSTIGINNDGDLGTVTVGGFYSNQLSACCVPSYAWSLVGDTLPPGLGLSAAGLLSGTPTSLGTYTFMIRAADATNPLNFGQRQFTMIVTPLSMTGSTRLPDGFVNSPYNASLTVTGGTGALTWAVAPGTFLPPGLTLGTGGTLSGTPTDSGQYSFRLTVTDAAGHVLTRWFSMSIYAQGTQPPLDLPIGPDLGTWGLGGVFIQLSASGGLPPYHYSLTPGAPTVPGMRVQDGQRLPTFFPADVTGGFIGVVTTPGTYSTSIRVTDAASSHFDRPVTITVSPLRNLSHFRPPKATVGQPYSFTFVPYGGSGNYSWSAENLPSGLTLSSSGQLSGTPTAAGTFFPSLLLTDLSTSDFVWEGFGLVVDPFAITTGGVLPPGTVNAAYSQAFTADCGGSCTWTTQGGVPFGLTLNGTTGVLSGKPQGTFNSSFTVQASGPAGTVQKIFSLRIVSAFVQPLAITTGSPADRTVGDSTQVALFAEGGTLPYAWSLVDGFLPPGVSLQSPGEAFSASFAPGFTYLGGRVLQVGTYNFTLALTDHDGTTITRAFTWRISALLWMDFSLPLSPGTPLVYNSPYTQPLLVVGGTGNYSWASAGNPMPPGLTVGSATGIVSGTPSNTGSFSSGIQVSDDAGNTVFQNVNFFVSGPTPTVINFGLGSNLGIIAQGFAFSRNLSPSGGTPPYTITALTLLPPGFALLSGDSLLGGSTPGSHLLSGVPLSSGTFSFTLQAQDSVGNIGVRAFAGSVVPLTLFTTTLLADGSVSTPYSQSLLIWSTGPVTWSVAAGSTMPPGLSVSAGGVISGTPTLAGSYNFSLAATDGSGATISFGFTLRISSLRIADPQILPIAVSGVPYGYTFTAIGSGATLIWTATGLPAGLTMSATGTISGTPTSTGGTSSVIVTVTDGVSPLSRRFVLFVRTPNPGQLTFTPFATALPDATVGQSFSFSFTGNTSGGVPPYAWSVASGSSLPPGLSLISGLSLPPNFVPGSTLLAGAPTTPNLYTFDLIVTDSAGTQVRRTFTLRVSAIGLVPGTPRTATVGTPYASQFTAVGGMPPYMFSMTPTSLVQDMLPPGMTLSASGLISGTTSSTGNYGFLLRVDDSAGNTFSRTFGFLVSNSLGLSVFSSNPPDASVGGGRSQTLNASGPSPSTYTWSLVSGTLPPGMALMPGTAPNTTRLAGQPTTPDTYVYTLRATDNADAANFADHQFTFRISPMQVVSPPVELMGVLDLPSAEAGSSYSVTFKVAGATPLYIFSESPFAPLPSGLTLSSAGVLSGTPQEVGVFTVAPIISDADGLTVNASSMTLVVTPAGLASPLTTSVLTRTVFDASLGVPYSLALDTPMSSLSRGGRAPHSWSLAAGSLPPGVELRPGGNGVPDHLGGVPSAAGTYGFSLTVADSSGQTATVPVSLTVSTLALTPDSAPPGTVGAAYSVSLGPSGGTPPYTIQLDPTSDLPPGLTLGASGLLSGVPTHPGNFFVAVFVTDSAGGALAKPYRITIDNAAGEAPALRLAPRPIQVYYEQGSPAPAPVPVSVDTTTGALPFALAFSGIPNASLSASSGTTSTMVNLTLDVSSLGPGTYVGLLGASAPQSANVLDSVPVTLTVAAPPPCSYTLNPTAGSVAAGGGTGSFDVAAGSLCSWTATTADSWITITAGSGTGAGTVSYGVSPNGLASQRNGTITVNGHVYTVTQFGSSCSFAINPVDLLAPAAGGTAFITITASDAACPPWTATGLGATPASGTGSGGVTVTIPPNGSPSPQVLTATIADQTLTVTQAGIGCTVSLSPYEASAPAAGGAGSVTVTTPAGCAYDTVVGPSWISVTSGSPGVGSGTVVYSVEPNSTTVSRSGSLTIGGQTFQVTEEGLACSMTVDTSGLGSPYGPAGGVGVVTITTNGTNCSWAASSGASWASVVPGSGTGNATIGVIVASNGFSATSRSTDLTIAGQTVTILQAGTTCTYSLQSPSGAVPASGGSGSVGVVAPSVCGWTATSNDPGWLAISSAGSAGSSNVLFVAQANPSANPRTGTLTIAGLTYTVTQAGAPCSYALDTVSPVIVSSGGATDFFAFSTTATGCTPAALSYVGWITVGTSFSGNAGTVTYMVAPNPSGAARLGTIQVGDQTFEVDQSAGACGYSLNAYGKTFSEVGGTGSVLGSPTGLGCTPDTGTDQPSFVLLDPLTGPVSNIFTQPYAVTPYHSLTIAIRRARITFGGQIFTVKQTSW
jgi:hypothetical protein